MIRTITTTLALLLAPTAVANEFDRPVDPPRPTIGSEIAQAVRKSAVRCTASHDWLSFAVCIDRLAAAEPNPTDAFRLGLKCSAQRGLLTRRGTAYDFRWPTANPANYQQSLAWTIEEVRELQTKLGLSDPSMLGLKCNKEG